jgi:hypothetical protein
MIDRGCKVMAVAILLMLMAGGVLLNVANSGPVLGPCRCNYDYDNFRGDFMGGEVAP